VFGQKANVKTVQSQVKFTESAQMSELLKTAVNETIKQLPDENIKPEEIAATVINLSEPTNYETGNYNGEMKIYPASVVKMFYLAGIHRQLEDGKIKLSPELERGLKDMIEVSSNDATGYILDVLTDSASGGELPDKEFKAWSYKRNSVNRFFSSLGYQNINVNQKTYCEDAYGREQQFRNFRGENRNMLTTNATARLMAEIALGKFVSAKRSQKMLELMKRDPFSSTEDVEDQAHGFTGISLVELGLKDTKLYSKAGWTSKTRHDAAFVEMPDGKKFVIVIFTQNHANQRKIIPGIASAMIAALTSKK
jgi:beta-lactamase class A